MSATRLAGGLVIGMAAWMLPVNLNSLNPVLLREAGHEYHAFAAGPSDAGNRDPILETILGNKAAPTEIGEAPVMSLFVPGQNRAVLRGYLERSGSLGVQAVLGTAKLRKTGRFVPAADPGGEPLDAVILLTALLYEREHLSPSLQREVRGMAEHARLSEDLTAMAPFYLDVLSLGRRLDWNRLSGLLQRTERASTVDEFARLGRQTPDRLQLLCSAALYADSADKVADYLDKFGRPGAKDLELAISIGPGATRYLLDRQEPVNDSQAPVLAGLSGAVLAAPWLMLAVKYLGFILGLFLILSGLDRWVVHAPAGPASRVRASLLALFLAGLAVVATEPHLLQAAPPAYMPVLTIPVLAANSAAPPASHVSSNHTTMDSSTIISIGVFALLQVVMYLICLRKIDQIAQVDLAPLLKLRLMENEENLFDSGLYVGMMGTAAALVLQVLGVIQPNLLAAYSSNLFGIVCVALVKIRHVRAFKRRLIMENELSAKLAPKMA